MRDVNFFYEYNKKTLQKDKNLKCVSGIALVISIIIVINAGIDVGRIFFIDRHIAKYNNELKDSELQEKLEESDKINSEIDILTQYDENINTISEEVKKRDNVSSDLFAKLNSKLPSEVNFKNISIKSNEIIIEGTSKSNDAVAEYEHNLKELSEMSSVFIESLDKSKSVDEEYSFKLNCVLKDVE